MKRILIVDDSAEIRSALRTLLSKAENATVVEATNGAEAIAVLQSEGAELVITDWKMDIMDGIECTRRIRAGIDGVDSRVPIILMTGMLNRDSRVAAYNAGVNEFLEKPFTPGQLFLSMAQALGGGARMPAGPKDSD
jgi:two-component system chemotaxis response regulator CheY/two-component system phosphate regulon response regulator PhoB